MWVADGWQRVIQQDGERLASERGRPPTDGSGSPPDGEQPARREATAVVQPTNPSAASDHHIVDRDRPILYAQDRRIRRVRAFRPGGRS